MLNPEKTRAPRALIVAVHLDGVDDTDNEDDGYEDINASEVTDGEMAEIDIKDLIKGKKYPSQVRTQYPPVDGPASAAPSVSSPAPSIRSI